MWGFLLLLFMDERWELTSISKKIIPRTMTAYHMVCGIEDLKRPGPFFLSHPLSLLCISASSPFPAFTEWGLEEHFWKIQESVLFCAIGLH